MHCTRIVSAVGAALASLTPWGVWLGLAPVPEGWAGLAAAGALFFLASATRRGAIVAASLAAVASLSRYEAWPVAALVGVVCAQRAVRERERIAFAGAAALAAAGPVFWLANNAIAHGDALHFVARVAEYRRRHAGAIPFATRVLEYPRALWADAPELVVAACAGAFAATRSRDLRARWALPLAGAALVLVFLIYGDVRDGAPTHHAARALVPLFGVLGGFGADGVASLASGRAMPRWVYVACGAAWLAFVLHRTRAVPGDAPDTRRDVQIARGRALAKTASSLEVTPCAYEHFALVAAFGAPERVVVAPATHAPVTPECPRVAVRVQNVRTE